MPSASRAACVTLQIACVAVVVLFIPAAAGLGYDAFAVPKEVVAAIAPLLAAALALLAARPRRLSWLEAALAGFLLVSAAALAQAASPTLAWRAFAVSCGGVAAFFAARRLAALGHRRALLAAAGAAAVLGALTVLLEAHGVTPELSMIGRSPGGTEGNRNYMAHLLVACLPLLLVGGARTSGSTRAGLLAGLAVVVMAIVLSRSRGAWLAGTAAVAVSCAGILLARRAGAAPRRLVAALLCCVVAGLAAVHLPNQLRWGSDDPFLATAAAIVDGDRGTGRGRLIQYRNTLAMIREAPLLGVGPGNWSLAYPAHASAGDPSYMPRSPQPVNRLPSSDWLGLAAERGLAAPLAALVAAAALAIACWRRLRSASESGADLAVVCLATMAAVAVAGVFDAVLLRPTPLLVVAVLIGASAPEGRGVAVPDRWARIAAALLALAAILVGVRLAPLVEATHHRTAYLTDGRVERLARAADATPDDYRLQMALALRWARRNRCDRAAGPARRALSTMPQLALARSILDRCGGDHATHTVTRR
jgi:O-antigen ligase